MFIPTPGPKSPHTGPGDQFTHDYFLSEKTRCHARRAETMQNLNSMAADGPGLVAGFYTVVVPTSEFVGKPTCTSF